MGVDLHQVKAIHLLALRLFLWRCTIRRVEHAHAHPQEIDVDTYSLGKTLIKKEEIQQRVKDLAAQIDADYQGKQLYIIAILKGAFIFMADLCRELSIDHTVDFMALSSYGQSMLQSGAVRIIMDLRQPIEGRHVLVVEDIVDSGSTLDYLIKVLKGRNPASLKTCVLVNKDREQLDVPIDYQGFSIPDVWVVGYGLDYAERYRTLPAIAALTLDQD